MFRNTAILISLLLGAALAGCSSRGGERLSESDYPYTGPPYEDSRYDHDGGSSGTAGASTAGARYAVESPHRYRPGGTDYYGRWAYAYGRDPSYDYYLASEDYWDGYDGYGDDADYGDYGGGYPVEAGYFYDELDPYGTWYQDDRYGWVWSPDYVAVEWRPYYNGYWVYTDWGWTWVSNDPWGSDTYHYGRWYCDASSRWLWIPDDVWAPAWVSWRYGGGWAGWAPLPPEASWGSSYGLRYADHLVLPSQWCFVPESRLTSTRLRTYVAPFSRSERLYRGTRDVTRYTAVNGRPAERGLRPALIERSTGRDIPKYRLVTRERGPRRESLRGRTLYAPMPVVSRGDSRNDAARARGRQERADRVQSGRQDRLDRVQPGRQDRQRFDREQRQRLERADRGQRLRQEREAFQRDRADRIRRDRAQRMSAERAQRDRAERMQQDRASRFERDRAQRMERDRGERIQRDRSERIERDRAEQRRRQHSMRMEQDRNERRQAVQARSERRQAERARYAQRQAEQDRFAQRQAAQQARRDEARREQASRAQARQEQAAQARQQVRQGPARQEQVRQERGSRQNAQERTSRGRGSNDQNDEQDDQREHGRGHGRNR